MEFEFNLPEKSILLVADLWGIYIPQRFCENHHFTMMIGIEYEDWEICLEGPDHPNYWEAWDEILNATILDTDGKNYCLWQDGDLWAVPTDWEDRVND